MLSIETHLYTMHQALTCDIIVYEAWDGSDALQCEPQYQIFWAVAAIQCDNFSSPNPEILQKPVADPEQAPVELEICPSLVLENKEELVRSLVQRMFF